MRIAYITADPGVPIFGQKGCSIHVQEVLRALGKHNAQIDLFATNCRQPQEAAPCQPLLSPPPHVSGDEVFEVFGSGRVHLHPLPPPPEGDLAFREQQCLAANDELRAALECQGPFTLVYERYSLWSFAGMEYARATATPGLCEVNAPLIEEQAEHRGLVDRANAQRVAERVFSAATALLAVSDEVAEYLERFPAARGKVQVVPNGVNPDRFPADLTPSVPSPAGTFTVGFVGTLKPWHGLPILLEAFAQLHGREPRTRLLIVGAGPEREKLAAEVFSRGLAPAVHFTGAVAPAEVPNLLASMDVAVAPYPELLNFYFSPLKVYEYMAAGLPVVASRVGQLQKLIEPGVNGLLVPPGDTAALAAALGRLQSDPQLRLRLGQAARATVIRQHTWDAVAEQILRLAVPSPGGRAESGERRAER